MPLLLVLMVAKTLLVNGLSTFPINGNPVFSNCSKRLPKNPPDCPILCNLVFENFILANELFHKALRIFETCILVNKNLYGKLVSSLKSPIKFDERSNLLQFHFYYRF